MTTEKPPRYNAMHRRGGDGVNKQKRNKITPKVEKPPFLG